MRKPFIAANWKMHKLGVESAIFTAEICRRIERHCKTRDVVVCPTYTSLHFVYEALSESAIGLGAQNMHWADNGSFTGEVSAAMLLTVGCSHVILGHSERRQLFGETDAYVNQKMRAALSSGLSPVLCVGETLAEREADRTEAVVSTQLKAAIDNISSDNILRTIVAYEPVWAIGTGLTATPEQADDVHRLLRSLLCSRVGKNGADSMRIVYGGSVKPDNAEKLFACENIDGGLIGGASLDAGSFAAIVQAAE